MRGTASSRSAQIGAATASIVLLAVGAMWFSAGGSDRGSSSSTSAGPSPTSSRSPDDTGSSTPTTRPNLQPADLTWVPVLTRGPSSLHIATPLLSMGQQIASSYTTSGSTSGSTVTTDAPMAPFFVGFRNDSAWITVQSDIVASTPWLAVPDATSMQYTAPNGDRLVWAKGDDGVDSALVPQSGDLEFIVRAKGLRDDEFVTLARALRAAPRPIFVEDPSGALRRLGVQAVVTVEGRGVIDAVTHGSVRAGTVYGTADGPVVVRIADQQSTDLSYLDLVATGDVRRSTDGFYSGTLRATHDDFIAWVDGDTRYTITAPAGSYDLEALARGVELTQLPTASLSSLPLLTFDEVASSLTSFGAADGTWGFDLVVGAYGRVSGQLITCFRELPTSATVPTSAVPSTSQAVTSCASQGFTLTHVRGVPHRVAVPGATVVIAAVDLPVGEVPTANLTTSSSHDAVQSVRLNPSVAGSFAVGVRSLSTGVPIDMHLAP